MRIEKRPHSTLAAAALLTATVCAAQSGARLATPRAFPLPGSHNDVPLVGERHLDNLEAAAQSLIDEGERVLVPSYRPAGLMQVIVGDRIKDPDWAGINVNRARPLSAPPDKIATLSNIEIGGGALSMRFAPDTHEYSVAGLQAAEIRITPVTTSTRYKSLTLNGTAAVSGAAVPVKVTRPRTEVAITVTSPDGSAATQYTLTVLRNR